MKETRHQNDKDKRIHAVSITKTISNNLLLFKKVWYLAHLPEDLQQQHEERVVDPAVQFIAALHGACPLAVPHKLRQRELTHPALFKSIIRKKLPTVSLRPELEIQIGKCMKSGARGRERLEWNLTDECGVISRFARYEEPIGLTALGRRCTRTGFELVAVSVLPLVTTDDSVVSVGGCITNCSSDLTARLVRRRYYRATSWRMNGRIRCRVIN